MLLAQVVTIFYELDLMPKVLIAGLPAEPSAYQRVGVPASDLVSAHPDSAVGWIQCPRTQPDDADA